MCDSKVASSLRDLWPYLESLFRRQLRSCRELPANAAAVVVRDRSSLGRAIVSTERDGYFLTYTDGRHVPHEAALMDLYYFDRHESFTVFERRLPHWSQVGVVTFITFRTRDSMPRDVVQQFHADRRQWLRTHRINPDRSSWRDAVRGLDDSLQYEFHRTFSERWNDELDASQGGCVLREPELSKVVADSLLHFDGDRYEILDFIVMPNHVHLLSAFPDDESMLLQCESWKHFTATKINRRLGVKGKFWQQDGFDHLVRSVEQLAYFRRYIADNPIKANCGPNETRHYSCDLTR